MIILEEDRETYGRGMQITVRPCPGGSDGRSDRNRGDLSPGHFLGRGNTGGHVRKRKTTVDKIMADKI